MNPALLAFGLGAGFLALTMRRGASSSSPAPARRARQAAAPVARSWCDRGPASLTDANMSDAAGMAGWVACDGRSFADVSLVLARMDALVARGGPLAPRIAAARSAVRSAWGAATGEPEGDEGDEFPGV